MATEPTPIAHIEVTTTDKRIAAQKWETDPGNAGTYIRMLLSAEQEIVDSVEEIDISTYVFTTYEVGNYVLSHKLVTVT